MQSANDNSVSTDHNHGNGKNTHQHGLMVSVQSVCPEHWAALSQRCAVCSQDNGQAKAPGGDTAVEIPKAPSGIESALGVFQSIVSRSTSKNGDQPAGSRAAESSPTAGSTEADWDEDDIPPPPPRRRLWQGIEGLSVMSFGVAVPLAITLVGIAVCAKRATLLLLNHPFETLVQLALLFAIPLANYLIWSGICKNDPRYSMKRGVLSGAAVGTSLCVTSLSFAAIPAAYHELQASIGTDFATGFCMIGFLAALSAATGIYLINKDRVSHDFPKSRLRVVACALTGLALAVGTLVGTEARSWVVRIAERQAISPIAAEHHNGLALLRQLNTERELLMESSDERAAGLVGLFFPIKHSDLPQLYFAVTGKPFRDINGTDVAGMSDDYVSRNVVGDRIKGLSLSRSAINGSVSPNTLTSTVNWTLVLRNDSPSEQEARAELAIPVGAAVTGLTVWADGAPERATFAASGKVEGREYFTEVGHTSPAVVTDLGRGRYLLHCYPVRPDEQLKIQLSVVIPLGLESVTAANLAIPRFIATNFDTKGEHLLSLRSPTSLNASEKNLKPEKIAGGGFLITGLLDQSQLEGSPVLIAAARTNSLAPLTAVDTIAGELAAEDEKFEAERQKLEARLDPDNRQVVVMIDGSKGVKEQMADVHEALAQKTQESAQAANAKEEPLLKGVVRTIKEVAAAGPRQVVVVLDGSVSVKGQLPEIEKALAQVPDTVPVSLMVASQESDVLARPTPLAQALTKLPSVPFVGGQDNLKAVVRASELAAESKGGVVLWIHGPQPALNRDIYIMAPFAAQPAFFELPLDSGTTDTLEFFKNHGEIGPFQPVRHNGSLKGDLGQFFAKWQPGEKEYVVTYAQIDEATPTPTLSASEVQELRALNAHRMVTELIGKREFTKAARIAVRYEIVSPVSSAVVLPNTPVRLQGATNGTIGPQAGDATILQGVNTAGTVRVNNLANLEALLNIIANCMEMTGLLGGLGLLLHGLFHKGEVTLAGIGTRLTPGMRISVGMALIIAGLSCPGVINWFVASARDANLFS